MNLLDIIEAFNNNDFDVKRYFNDYETFFNILKKRGLMSEIEPYNASDSEEWQNEYLLWLWDNDKEKYYKWVEEFLQDVKIENGVGYLFVNDVEDLTYLFCDSGYRDTLSHDTILSIMTGDYDYDRYWDTTDNVYRDVIKELNEKNTNILYQYIILYLKDQKIEPSTDVLEIIAEEQGHPEYVDVNVQSVIKIVNDEETMIELLNNELSELKSELYSIHSNAYNSAYESELYELVWGGLSKFLGGEIERVMVPHSTKKDTSVEYIKIKVDSMINSINSYLFDNKKYGNSGTLYYIGSYVNLLRENNDCIKLYPPDYPDYSEIDKNINEYFSDYIYI